MWQVVGLKEIEGQVYEALVLSRKATVEQLVIRTELTPARITRVLQVLTHCGLATRLPGRPARFTAAEPEIATAALTADHEQQLRRLRAHAKRLAEATREHAADRHPAELIEVIEGPVNIRRAFLQLQGMAREQLRLFDKPPYFEKPSESVEVTDLPEWNPELQEALQDRQVLGRGVYDRASLLIPGRMKDIWASIRRGERARVSSSVPLKMAICDDKQALITSVVDERSGSAYLVHPSALLDALQALFEAVWERSVPLSRAASEADDEPLLTGQRRELLSLLAGGATDEAIARTFHWSVRTVQRHIHALMTGVGAETRFQIGMEAVRRGWL